MPFGFDISADALRFSSNENGSDIYKRKFGITGVAPIENEPFVWDNPSALRNSKLGNYISLMDAWAEFNKNSIKLHQNEKFEVSNCRWSIGDEEFQERPAAGLIAEALSQNNPKSRISKSILAIDNTLHEFQQDSILEALDLIGFTNIELLWRPICLALHYLKTKGRHQFHEEDRLIIVDTDSFFPELTVLSLKEYNGELVPVRNLPKYENPFGSEFNTFNLINKFLMRISDSDQHIIDQLKSGPNSQALLSWLAGNEHNDIWVRDGILYNKFPLINDLRDEF